MRKIHVIAGSLLVLLSIALAATTVSASSPFRARASVDAHARRSSLADPHAVDSTRAQRKAAYHRWRQTSLQSLAARGDAGSLLAAAVITENALERARLVRAAAKVAPTDADIAWAQWWFCARIAGCQRADVLARIRKLEPGNAAAWMVESGVASDSNRPGAIDKALQRIAAKNRFDDHLYAIARRTELARMNLPLPPVAHALTMSDTFVEYDMQRIGGLGVPGVTAVIHACADPANVSRRRAACAQIAALLMDGGRPMYEILGSALATVETAASDHRPGHSSRVTNPALAGRIDRARQCQRTVAWRAAQWSTIFKDTLRDPAVARIWQAAIRDAHSQSAMIATVLKARGIALQPPAGWRPQDPGKSD